MLQTHPHLVIPLFRTEPPSFLLPSTLNEFWLRFHSEQSHQCVSEALTLSCNFFGSSGISSSYIFNLFSNTAICSMARWVLCSCTSYVDATSPWPMRMNLHSRKMINIPGNASIALPKGHKCIRYLCWQLKLDWVERKKEIQYIPIWRHPEYKLQYQTNSNNE